MEIKTFFRQIKLPCEPKRPPPASSPPQRATAVGDLSLNSQQEGFGTPPPIGTGPPPAPPQTLHAVTIDRHGLSRGLEPPGAAARPVSGSVQVDHLRVPGGAAHVSSYLLCSWGVKDGTNLKSFYLICCKFKMTYSTKNCVFFFSEVGFKVSLWHEPRWRPFIWRPDCPDYWIEYLIKSSVSAGWILISCHVFLDISHVWSPVRSLFDRPPDNRR